MEAIILIIIVAALLAIGLYINYRSAHSDNKSYNQSDLEKFGIEKMKTCPVCNTKNHINRKYCKHCNTWIKNITCPVCEHVNPFDQKYCEECNSVLRNKTRY